MKNIKITVRISNYWKETGEFGFLGSGGVGVLQNRWRIWKICEICELFNYKTTKHLIQKSKIGEPDIFWSVFAYLEEYLQTSICDIFPYPSCGHTHTDTQTFFAVNVDCNLVWRFYIALFNLNIFCQISNSLFLASSRHFKNEF